MTVTIDQIQGFLQTRNLHYFTSPDNETLLLPYRLGPRLSVKVLIRVDCEGSFLQIACNDLPMVESGHPMIGQVQQCLLAFSNSQRFVKFSQDPDDGEITVAGDAWLEDMELTERAFSRMMSNFLQSLTKAGEAIDAILQGRGDTQDAAPQQDLPDALRRLLDRPDDHQADGEQRDAA